MREITADFEGQKLADLVLWQFGHAATSKMSVVIADRVRRNGAYVRELLWQRQPGFAAALASAEQYLSCQDLEISQSLTCGAQLRLCLRWLRTTDPAPVCLDQLFE
jgi:hypothetical protein